MKVAFIHPDLGIGGAERLVIDAALEFMDAGHEVVMYTGYHDVTRCFEETLTERGERAGWVRVHGSWVPRHFFGIFHALLASVRCLWATCALLLHDPDCQVVVVDQVSSPIVLLRLASNAAVLFYCHFPDMLLATRKSFLRRLYRAPVNAFEEISTGLAHKVVVNSKFTAEVFAKTFQSLYRKGAHPAVVYPAVALENAPSAPRNLTQNNEITFLSVNRFERKKNLELALRAFAKFREDREHLPSKLILAGGYDARLRECVEYRSKLEAEAKALGVFHDVEFRTSVSNDEKRFLLERCTCVLYTPSNEHFGIVPLEAMAFGKPVIACDSGGPKESIVNGVTGFLCDATPASFAAAMAKIAADSGDGDAGSKAFRMGVLARQRVEWKFSRKAFGDTMLGLMPGLLAEAREKRRRNARRTENVVVVVLVVATATLVRALLGALVAFVRGAVF
jgi:alpha-1,3/alpha-1,6-mannosyltransferase